MMAICSDSRMKHTNPQGGQTLRYILLRLDFTGTSTEITSQSYTCCVYVALHWPVRSLCSSFFFRASKKNSRLVSDECLFLAGTSCGWCHFILKTNFMAIFELVRDASSWYVTVDWSVHQHILHNFWLCCLVHWHDSSRLTGTGWFSHSLIHYLMALF